MKKLIISGRVQGVGYRYYTYKNANFLGIHGTVRNLADGNVEVIIANKTSEKDYKKFLSQLYKGPGFSNVYNIEEKYIENDKEFKDFSII